MSRNVMLVVNPVSGRGLSRFAIGTIVSQLCGNEYDVTVYYTGSRSPEEITFEYARGNDLIVCVGGDGTLSGVTNGLLRAGATIPVGFIPMGTANDVATTLTLARDPREAARTIVNGHPKPLDVGTFSSRFFVYIAAFGAFTGVAYSTPQSAKRSLGHLAYVLGGLADVSAIKARHTVVEFDGQTIEGDFIFGGVMNSTSVAGIMKLDPKLVDLADGLFEIILVKQPVDPVAFFDILASLATQSYDGDNVLMYHASNVKFTFQESVAWTVDGEDGGSHSEVEMKNCHKAISIIV